MSSAHLGASPGSLGDMQIRLPGVAQDPTLASFLVIRTQPQLEERLVSVENGGAPSGRAGAWLGAGGGAR